MLTPSLQSKIDAAKIKAASSPQIKRDVSTLPPVAIDMSKYGVVLPEFVVTDTPLTAGGPKLSSFGWIIGAIVLGVVGYWLYKKVKR